MLLQVHNRNSSNTYCGTFGMSGPYLLLLLAYGAKMSTEMTVEQKRPAAFAAVPLPKDDVKPPLCSQPLSFPLFALSLFFSDRYCCAMT